MKMDGTGDECTKSTKSVLERQTWHTFLYLWVLDIIDMQSHICTDGMQGEMKLENKENSWGGVKRGVVKIHYICA